MWRSVVIELDSVVPMTTRPVLVVGLSGSSGAQYGIRLLRVLHELGLPGLTPHAPWFGYQLGYWPDSWDKATKLTSQGRYLEPGEDFRKLRTKASYFETGIVDPPDEETP